MIDLKSLAPLFRPASIAIVGASDNPAKIGGLPIRYLKAAGFSGAIHPVNPARETVQGLTAWPRLADIPGDVDLVVIAVPARDVRGVLLKAAEKGVKGAIIFSAGFAELGASGAVEQAELAAIGRGAGIRMLGPNCSGFANFSNGAWVTFAPLLGEGQARPGNVGMVSQSGAFANFGYRVGRDRGVAFSQWITTGNAIDVDVADGVAFLADDPQTKAILFYMEGCADGRKFADALAFARSKKKPVIGVKVGATGAGAAAVGSHTASLAGADHVFDAVMRQHGVYRARTVEELFDIGYAAANGAAPVNDKVAIASISGGVGVLLADAAASCGLDVAPMPAAAQDTIRGIIPFAGATNPVDVTAQVINDLDLLEKCLDVILQQGEYGTVACFMGYLGLSEEYSPRILPLLNAIRARRPDSTVVFSTLFRPEIRAQLVAEGHLFFEEPTHAIRAVSALRGFADSFSRQAEAAPQLEKPAPALAGAEGALNEFDSLSLLREAGVPAVAPLRVRFEEEARRAFRALAKDRPGPVVLKILSSDLMHKSDVGGVALGLETEDAAAEAFARITSLVAENAPDARTEGCLLAPMMWGGVETILGVARDPIFGPVVMFGLGGVFAETLKDVTFRVAPFGEEEAARMIGEIRASAVLGGVRGAPAVDRAALARALSTLSRFAAANADRIESVDVNPFLVRPEGAVALDAVVTARARE
ncbi:acetate--CoA ligase family protein [Pikeienuella piscinae]|uniref:Acetate--CoA ligase family protein n=1 Tax=Pikeienuella piscinae TaxID=2748098 RepID=A0A7L5C0I5_9RHOB|nr:acetate--CoA ligase family protein [Pikeienuella piscinae]QIE56608.1 acetate--CoA ligase family protein [Pikeienuella piscinae]